MKTRPLIPTLVCCLTLAGAVQAQSAGAKKPSGPKPPADVAFDTFNRERGAGGAKDQARFQKVIGAGMAYLEKYPTHGRVNEVVTGLAFYASGIDRKQAELRISYVSLLKLELTNLRYKEGVGDNTKAALAGLDAAIADFEVREVFNRDNLNNFREKIDALGTTPGAARFLAERERSYVHLLTLGTSLARAEEHLKRLVNHKDKGVAAMARTELNLVEVKKTPYALKFAAFDGKEVDFAQLRGKVVALYCWSSTHKGSLDNFEGLQRIHSAHRKRGLEFVTASFDKAEDRAKVATAIKDRRIAWPVHYDGKGAKSEWAAKLNVTGVPALLVFDQKGMLQHTMQGTVLAVNLPVTQLEGQVKRLLGIK